LTNSPWFDALFDPAGMLILAASVVSGLIAAWWLFPIGILLWLIIVIRTLRDPSLRLKETVQNRTDLAQRIQGPYSRIQNIQISIFNAVQGTDSSARRVLKPVLDEVERLTSRLYELCRQMTPVENLRLVSPSDTKLEVDLNNVLQQAQSATDARARAEYEQSASAIRERQKKYRQLCDQMDRFEALLGGTENDLQAILSDIVQVPSLPKNRQAEAAGAIRVRVKTEIEQLESFSSSPG
jgi:hypothetical protein